jgi:hypothetical protein
MTGEFRFLLGLCLSCLTLGCVANQPRYEVEVITLKDQALSALQSTPTNFSIHSSEDRAAWNRASYFLQQYGGGLQEGRPGILRGGSSGSVTYEVIRRPDGDQVRYQVSCLPDGSKVTVSEATLNAQNLARFIVSGELELSMLKQ